MKWRFAAALALLSVPALAQQPSTTGKINTLDIGVYCTRFIVGGTTWIAAQGVPYHDDFIKVLAAHYARNDTVFVAGPTTPGYEFNYPPTATCAEGELPNAIYLYAYTN